MRKVNKHRTNANNIVSYALPTEFIDFNSTLLNLALTKTKYFYSSTPDYGIKFLGIDSIFDIEESGIDRVKNTSYKIESLNLSQKSNFYEHSLKSVPLFLGGMKFAPDTVNSLWNDYKDSEWFIPKYMLYMSKNKSYIIFNFLTETITEKDIRKYQIDCAEYLKKDESRAINNDCSIVDSNHDSLNEKLKWISQVSSALKQIEENRYHKIVLSRQVDLELSCSPNFSRIIGHLENSFPKCYIFAFRKNNSTFFGASPEKLAKVSNGWVEADALAGSIRRGDDDLEDTILADELLSSEKNLNEQKAVVEFITNSFKDFSEEIIFDDKPIIRKLPNIQHLWTPIKARLKKDKSILSLLKDIHPTPAICGVPWDNALVSIQEMESHSRGLFAGMVGWFNLENEGEFAVAIRSALSIEDKIYALAGCGIVEGSDPELEYTEAELKLRPILSLFKDEEIYQP